MGCEVINKERVGVINPIYDCQPAGAQYATRHRHQGLHTAGPWRPGLHHVRAASVRPALQGELRDGLVLAARGLGRVRRPYADRGRPDRARQALSEPARHSAHHHVLDGSDWRRLRRRRHRALRRSSRRSSRSATSRSWRCTRRASSRARSAAMPNAWRPS